MAEDYVEHIRGQVIGDVEGFDEGVWTGVVDDEGQCQVRELEGTTRTTQSGASGQSQDFVMFSLEVAMACLGSR